MAAIVARMKPVTRRLRRLSQSTNACAREKTSCDRLGWDLGGERPGVTGIRVRRLLGVGCGWHGGRQPAQKRRVATQQPDARAPDHHLEGEDQQSAERRGRNGFALRRDQFVIEEVHRQKQQHGGDDQKRPPALSCRPPSRARRDNAPDGPMSTSASGTGRARKSRSLAPVAMADTRTPRLRGQGAIRAA